LFLKIFLPGILGLALLLAGDLIHGCVNKTTGDTRIVSSGTDCTADETSLEWGIMGLQGAPGPAGPQGTYPYATDPTQGEYRPCAYGGATGRTGAYA
jgi:hypothetical protein